MTAPQQEFEPLTASRPSCEAPFLCTGAGQGGQGGGRGQGVVCLGHLFGPTAVTACAQSQDELFIMSSL